MKAGWAKDIFFAFAVWFAMLTPAVAERECIQEEFASLIYDPDEPPICPPPMSEHVPSRLGRPQNFTAEELAVCAGLWDAALVLEPRIAAEPSFMDVALFFELAKAQRERPPLSELAEIRHAAKQRYMAFLQDPEWIGSSAIPHSFSYCNGVYHRAGGE